MRRPRCGLPDRRQEEAQQEAQQGSRRRRYTLTGQQWDKDHLTYSLLKQQIPASLGEERTSVALRRAFEVTPAPLADILVLFASGFHGDMSLFDGEGGSLAHAYYPGPGMGGDTHFDADEPWTLDHQDPAGIDLFLVAVHELGHALGLEHSDQPHAVMAPFYRPPLVTGAPPTSAPAPSPDGEPDRPASRPPPEAEPTAAVPRDPPPRPTTRRPPTARTPDLRPPAPPRPTVPERPDHVPPDICEGDFDSVTVLRGEMFVFKGRWFWRVRRNRVLDNYPMPISVFWNGLPDNIDAAYERHDGKFVFFKGERYWVFREADVLPGYPQPLRDYGRGLPDDRIDTGVFLSDNGAHTFFYKGSNYWRFDNQRGAADPGYPRSILKDFMGCRDAPDPAVDPVTQRPPPPAPPGFSSALPRPSGTPGLSRSNSDARPGDDGERPGVIRWVTQGLTKVLPQPEEKYRETNDLHTEQTEVQSLQNIPDVPDGDPLPHVPVVEMVSEGEMSEAENVTPQFPPKVVKWIKQAIPQPVILPPGSVVTEPSPRSNRSSMDRVLSSPPESLSGILLDDKPGGMMGWVRLRSNREVGVGFVYSMFPSCHFSFISSSCT
ncbi:hypothetical protein NHX12_002892 [Muraenolepis orangiensis]|uniref:Peptidase metallopeptidase domain-containing protein n=1 Tax=Muraenolepis orangiensis TaxID=630683 RepID=A0A9Q0IFL6_9TELE|nr:hypothetical protein NHX12_002892 [Muraenolepis orangiensis]